MSVIINIQETGEGSNNGTFSPLVNNVTELKAIVVIAMAIKTILQFVDNPTVGLVSWQLVNDNTSPVDGPALVVPVDYNPITNSKVWISV